MNQEFSSVDVSFHDLNKYFKQICSNHENPDELRRSLKSYLMASQQLTAMMRVEFKKLTGKKWNAMEFSGWNSITILFKELRNTSLHDVEIQMWGSEISILPIFPDTDVPLAIESLIPFTSEKTYRGLKFYEADPETGRITDIEIVPKRKEFIFSLHSTNTKISSMIEKIPEKNLHILCKINNDSLVEYYGFYKKLLVENNIQ